MRRVSILIAGLLAGFLVFPFAGTAQAYVDTGALRDARLRMPSGVIGSLEGIGSNGRVEAVKLTTVPESVTGAPGAGGAATAVGRGASVLPGLGTALTGLGIGWEIGQWINGATGLTPEPGVFVPNTDAAPGSWTPATVLHASTVGPGGTNDATVYPLQPEICSGGVTAYGTSCTNGKLVIMLAAANSSSTSSVNPTSVFVYWSAGGSVNNSTYISVLGSTVVGGQLEFTVAGGVAEIVVAPPGTSDTASFTGVIVGTPADPDPDRYFRSTWSCRAKSDGTIRNDQADSAMFKESDTEWAPIPDMPCEADEWLNGYIIIEKTAGGVLADKTIATWDAPAALKEVQDQFPQCADGSCRLELYRIGTGTERISCFSNPAVCADWFTSPTKTDDYVCTYGGEDVPLSECNAYSDLFKDWPTTTNPRDKLRDPKDGSDPSSDPSPEPSDDCPPGVGLSTLTPWWWYKAAVCALEYAFVPRGTVVQAEVTDIVTAWEGTPPGEAAAVVGNVCDAVCSPPPGTSDCEGPGIDLGVLHDPLPEFHPISACGEFEGTVATFFKPFITLFLWLGGLWTTYRIVVGSIGLNG